MARRVLPLAVAAAPILLLAGCSDFGGQARRPAWRTQAEEACIAQHLVQPSAYVQPAAAIDGPGICGLTQPFKVTALLDGQVTFDGDYTLDCPMIAALNEWVRDVVEPAAQARFGARVVEILSFGTYSCRGINGMAGARLSEHAFGNAIDISGFRLSDGREITVVRDWYHGDPAAQAFLRDVHGGACNNFTTVLGPGYNIFHYNHIHVDLAMRGDTSTGPRRVCRPDPQTIPVNDHPPDGLPEPPPLDDDVDISQAGAANAQALALHAPGGDLDAAVPSPIVNSAYHSAPPVPGSAYRPYQQSASGADDQQYQAAQPYRPQQSYSSYRQQPAAGSDYRPYRTYQTQQSATASNDQQPYQPVQSYRPQQTYSSSYQQQPAPGSDYRPYRAYQPQQSAPGSDYQPYHAYQTQRPAPGADYQPYPQQHAAADYDQHAANAYNSNSYNYSPAPRRAATANDSNLAPEGRPADWDLSPSDNLR
jgi:hypothetical protein